MEEETQEQEEERQEAGQDPLPMQLLTFYVSRLMLIYRVHGTSSNLSTFSTSSWKLLRNFTQYQTTSSHNTFKNQKEIDTANKKKDVDIMYIVQ